MKNSGYDIIEIVGTSAVSWEEATKTAVLTASRTVEDLRVAEVIKKDVIIEDGKVSAFRVRLSVSFRYHPYRWLGYTGRYLEQM